MVSTLVSMIRHWIGTIMHYDVKPSITIIHQALMLYGLSTLSGY